MDGAEGMTPELWKKIAEQGWLGLIYPEAYGGMGLGFVDLTVLMEEMGRAVMPGPSSPPCSWAASPSSRRAPRHRRRRGSPSWRAATSA